MYKRQERTLAAGEQRQAAEPLAGWACLNVDAGLGRVVGIGHHEARSAAPEERLEVLRERLVDDREGGDEARANLLVEFGDC